MNMRDTNGFGQRFTQALEYAGYGELSARKLGAKLGVSATAAVAWKKGEKIPGVERIVELADQLGVEVGWLLTGRGQMSSRPAIKIFSAVLEKMDDAQRSEVLNYAAYILDRARDNDTRTPILEGESQSDSKNPHGQ